MKEDIESYRIEGERYCVADEMIENGIKKGNEEYHSCGSSDALSVYENVPDNGETFYTGYCYSCSQHFNKQAFHNSSHATDFGIEGGVVKEKKTFERKPKAEPITKEEVREVLGYGYEGKGERGLKDKYNQFFGHVTKLDRNGKPKVRFYPETKDGKLTGYKSRTFPKSFGYENKGQTGIKSDLSGQVKFKDYHGRDILIVGGECFTEDTSVMTQYGWKSIKEVNENRKLQVMQVDSQGYSSLVYPSDYIRKDYEGDLIHYSNKYYDSLTTPNHNLVAVGKKGLYKFKAQEGVRSSQHKTPLCAESLEGSSGVALSDDQLALIVAIAADSKVDERKTKADVVHFSFQKLRKRVRLQELLDRLNIDSRNFDKVYPDGRHKFTFNFELPDFIKKKGLPVDWLHLLSQDQRLFILKEQVYWDGNFVKDRNSVEFSSKLYEEADFIRNLAKLSGVHANLRSRSNSLGSWYSVRITWDKVNTSWQQLKRSKNTVPYKGEVFCVTVPTGLLLVKRNEKVYVTGNCDKVAAFQIFDEYQESRYKNSGNEYAPMPVVCPTTGEGSAIKQIRDQYDFINRFDNIYLGLDNDEVGIDAMMEIAEIFPKEKIRICYWTHKDPNGFIYNKEGKDYSAQFVRDFYNAKPFVSMGIVTSKEANDSIEEELLRPKISLPDFMIDLQKKMAGGIPIGYMVNFIAESGIGKSTLVNEAIRHIIYTAPYKVGILSLELTAAQYMIAMLSREVGKKINLFETPEEAVAFVRQPDVQAARKHLCMNEFGEERFVLLDERDGDLDEVKTQCELLVNKYGCQILIIDPIQDLFEGVGVDQQNSFLKWMKIMLKKGVTFIDVCHVRKGNTSTDKEGRRILRELSEDDVHGISAIVKSAGANVFMSRNKYAEHFIEKNTTFVTLGKCRWTGHTGRIGSWYYNNDTHTMYDLRKYFKEHPDELNGYDLDYNPFVKGKPEGFSKKAGGGKTTTKDPVDFNIEIDMGDGVKL